MGLQDFKPVTTFFQQFLGWGWRVRRELPIHCQLIVTLNCQEPNSVPKGPDILDSSGAKRKLLSELKALIPSSLPKKCLISHEKFSFLSRLYYSDIDPIKKANTLVFQVKANTLTPFPTTQYVHTHLGSYCIIRTHLQKTFLD